MKGVELSRRRLIANCSAAVLPRRELISRIASTLEGIEPELRQEFETLMADGRASLCIMRLTAGDMDLIDRDKSLALVEEMRKELVAPVIERAETAEARAAEIEKLATVKLEEATQKIQDVQLDVSRIKEEGVRQASEFDLQFAQLRLEIENEKLDKLNVAGELERTQVRLLQDIGVRSSAYERKRLRFSRRLRAELLVLAVIIIAAAVSQDSALWIRISAALVSIVTMGAFARIGDRVLRKLADRQFKRDLEAIDALKAHLK
ncbi:hypothetical protein [Xanthomonas sacchari]|uniref:hypothetical protein n=1 Tax=Xanthomonas sacchari TaxID=56458 RepID=UPI002257296C|nr:hypothetical protein [Xanthomonas sacchari]